MQDDEQEALGSWWRRWRTATTRCWKRCWRTSSRRPAEIYNDLRKDLAAGSVIEVLLGSAENAHGVRRLWKALRHDAPFVRKPRRARPFRRMGHRLAQIFKTVHAGHTGKLSYARVWRGAIKDGATLGGSRLGGIYHFAGGELAKCAEAVAGDVVAFGRLEGVRDRRHGVARRDAGAIAVPRPAGAGLFAGDRHVGPQGRREAERRAEQAARGGSDSVDRAGAGDGRDGAARPGRDASECHRGSAGEAITA